jgi:hypothetical protein
MLNRFGVPTEVLIDQIIEFHEDFQKLCEKALIDHGLLHKNILRQMS